LRDHRNGDILIRTGSNSTAQDFTPADQSSMTDLTDTMPTGRSPDQAARRARLFRAALALSGQSGIGFAESLGVGDNHIYLVLRGVRRSDRIDQAIDALIAEELPTVQARELAAASEEEA